MKESFGVPRQEVEQIRNSLDVEFDELESEVFSFDERMEVLRVLSDELLYGNTTMARDLELHRSIKRNIAGGDPAIRHFLLPNIPGGEGSIKSIREAYDDRAFYKSTDQRMIARVGQGEMWMVKNDRNPLLRASMSECSAIVARNDEYTILAHISFSEIVELDAVLSFLRECGVDMESIYAIASIGETQIKEVAQFGGQRAVDVAAYEGRGFLPQNILPFEFVNADYDAKGSKVMTNIGEVVVTKEGLFSWCVDIRSTLSPFFSFQTSEERVGDYKYERMVKF